MYYIEVNYGGGWEVYTWEDTEDEGRIALSKARKTLTFYESIRLIRVLED